MAEESQPFKLGRDQSCCLFSAATPPALVVDSGAVVSFETNDDAYARLSAGESLEEIGLENFNAVTGPVFVRDAVCGDALKIYVQSIEIVRAWIVWLPNFGALGHAAEDTICNPVTFVEVEEGTTKKRMAKLSPRLMVPEDPMIGCIGTAPSPTKTGSGSYFTASTLSPVYKIGGNMDLRELSPGATIFLPVEVDGGLLSVGDVHAAMGTGEPASVSLESGAIVTLRIELVKNMPLRFPRLKVDNQVMCLAFSRSFGEARSIAINEAFKVLTDEFKLTPFEAYAYVSSSLSLRFGGPAHSIVLAVFPEPTLLSL